MQKPTTSPTRVTVAGIRARSRELAYNEAALEIADTWYVLPRSEAARIQLFREMVGGEQDPESSCVLPIPEEACADILGKYPMDERVAILKELCMLVVRYCELPTHSRWTEEFRAAVNASNLNTTISPAECSYLQSVVAAARAELQPPNLVRLGQLLSFSDYIQFTDLTWLLCCHYATYFVGLDTKRNASFAGCSQSKSDEPRRPRAERRRICLFCPADV